MLSPPLALARSAEGLADDGAKTPATKIVYHKQDGRLRPLPVTISVRSLLKCITLTSVCRKFTHATTAKKKISGGTLGRLSDAVYCCLNKHE